MIRNRLVPAALVIAAIAFGSSLGVRPVKADPDDKRTFEVTVESDDSVTDVGRATAKLVDGSGQVAVYELTREVGGPSAKFTRGKAYVDRRTHEIRIEFVSDGGLVRRLAASDEDEAPEGTTSGVLRHRDDPEQVLFEGDWATGNFSFHETWRELTQFTSEVTIVSPEEGSSLGGSGRFEATVSEADHVDFFIDQYHVSTFQGGGRHVLTQKLLRAGWRAFTVKARGKRTTREPEGKLLGEASVFFEARGLKMTPGDGETVAAMTRVEVEPIGLGKIARVDFRMDGKLISTDKLAPFRSEMHFGRGGTRRIEAVAYGADGRELARTLSRVKVPVPRPDSRGAGLPLPGRSPTDSAIDGKPAMTVAMANPRNFTNRTSRKVDMIVLHKAEGSLDGTVTWFRNPKARVSAHYVVSESRIVRMLDDEDIAWHAGNTTYNRRSIGIENDGFTNRNDVSDAQYRRLAGLVAFLCRKHGIPIDRNHLIGHDEVPDPRHPGRKGGTGNHEDPGRYWDWNKFMRFVREAAGR